MRTSTVGMYALRLTFGQASQVASQASVNSFSAAASPDRIVTRSATMLAVFGIALSSFSVKQMLTSGGNKPVSASLRKF